MFIRKLLRAFGWGRLGGLVLLFALLALRIADPSVVETIRNQSFDLYQRMKPRLYQPAPVAIVDIDERSIEELGQWPWPRTRMAELVTKIQQAGAAAMAFDIVFSEADRLSPAAIAFDNPDLPPNVRAALENLPSNDDVFAEAIANARVALGQTSVRRNRDKRKTTGEPIKMQYGLIGPDPRPNMQKFPDLVRNRTKLEEVASGRGLFTVRPDPDGVYRKVPLVMQVQGKLRLALSVELLRVATGGGAFAVKSNEAGISSLIVARQPIETDRDGTVWPYFTQSRPSRYVPVADVISGEMPATRLRGHMVLVGTSAVGLEDYRATPMGVQMAGVEIHAQVLENILAKTMLVRPNYAIAVELATTLLLGLLIIALVPYFGATRSVLFAVILLAGYVGASWYGFSSRRLLIDPSLPLISAGALFIFMATMNYIREERQRQQIRGAFGQYVSPALVDQLSDEPEKLKLGGETLELSVLFSDVRGFTAISESFKDNPEGLTQLMNSFLTELSNAVLEEEGTIDKFMGDAIMAFWNAPIAVDDHAARSCRAAIAMIERVKLLNESMAQQAKEAEERGEEFGILHEINVGIGVNTGSCVVGNMGSDNRFDYTALGDTVNIASRLEGQSKPYGIKIVLGETTAQQVEDQMALLEVDLIRVKGKIEPARIFGLFGGAEMLTDDSFIELQSLNASMLKSYRSQDWDAAFAALELMRDSTMSAELMLEDYLFIYETRIAEFSTNPPGQDWDGVFTATSK